MKDFNYKERLTKIVPPNIRLEVYKIALEYVKKWEELTFGLETPQLCFLLPTILYNQSHFQLRKVKWYFEATTFGFPELTIEWISKIEKYNSISDELRIEFLKESINKLENEISTTV